MEILTTVTNVLSRETISDKIGDTLIKRCMSIPELLLEFKSYLNRELNGIKVLSQHDEKLIRFLIDECDSWNLDEEENVI